MLIVEIWKVKGGVDRSTAIASMRDCAVHYGDEYQRAADACSYVDRVYKCNDKCASSANAAPMGFRVYLKELSPEQYLEFNRCFNFKEVAPKPEVQLKLFKIEITGLPASQLRAGTVARNFSKGGMMLVTGTDEDSTLSTLQEEDGKVGGWLRTVEPERISIMELPGPFEHVTVIVHREF